MSSRGLQSQAAEAVALWDSAEDATAAALVRHRAEQREQAAWFRAEAGPGAIVPVLEFVDPGDGVRVEARELLEDARGILAVAGDEAAARIRGAADAAPADLEFWAVAPEAVRAVWELSAGVVGGRPAGGGERGRVGGQRGAGTS